MDHSLETVGIDRETLHQSFQQFCRAKNISELAKSFHQVLEKNQLSTDTVIFFRNDEKSGWQKLFSSNRFEEDVSDLLQVDNDFRIIDTRHERFPITINLPLDGHASFRILLGKGMNQLAYNEPEKISLQFFLQQLDNAYQVTVSENKEKQLIFELNHRVLQLNSLIDTSIEIARLQEGNHLLRLALERVIALTNASRGMLQIKAGRKVHEKFFFPAPFKLKNKNQDYFNISTSFHFNNKKYSFFLFEKESRKGFIQFDNTDQLLLDAFARQVHVSLENRYLYEESLAKQRIDSEISLAGTIQKKLIPDKLPEIEGYDQYGINIPTRFIGGDYYDCIHLKDGRYMFIMADVSGKGVAAGLLVSTLQASAHAYIDGPFELESLVQKLNEVINDAATEEKYITAVFAILEPKSGKLQAINAGHNPTYVVRKDKNIEELKIGGIPLGAMGIKFPYESSTFILNPGDSVFFYTDGVTEAMNERSEEYDMIRPLKTFLKSHQAATAKEFIDQLMTDMNKFTGDTPQTDDITALYLMKKDV